MNTIDRPVVPETEVVRPWNFTVTIDGPAGAGKGELAMALAHRHQLRQVETGAYTRALGMLTGQANLVEQGELKQGAVEYATELVDSLEISTLLAGDGRKRIEVNGIDCTELLQTEEAGRCAGLLARHEAVQATLWERWRELADQEALVIDGRIVGNKILPAAPAKVFLTARAGTRALRRGLQEGTDVTNPETLQAYYKQICERDSMDQAAGLMREPEAGDIVVDTSDMSRQEVCEVVESVIERAYFGVH